MFTYSTKQIVAFAASLLLSASVLAGCVANAAPAVPAVVDAAAVAPAVTPPAAVEIIAKDYSFVAPAQIDASWVTIHLKNEGQERHHVQLMRLNDGATMSTVAYGH